MLMQHEYLADLKEWIRNTPDNIFVQKGLSKQAILADNDLMDRLWTIYQKDVEEYDCDPDYSYGDALLEVLGIHYQP